MLEKENWDILLNRAFGINADDTSNHVSLDTCRSIAVKVAEKLKSDEFTATLEQEIKSTSEPQAKQAAVMELMIALHMEIMPAFDLQGEDGYVRLQSSMMQYSSDEQLMRTMQEAMMHVQNKAGGLM